MPWPTWYKAAIALVLAVALAYLTRGRRNRLERIVNATSWEFTVVAMLFSLWRLARVLSLGKDEGAIDRARWIWNFEQTLRFPSELALQQWVVKHDLVAMLCNWYYAALHMPTLVGVLVWLWVRHRDDYPRWRNGLIFVTFWSLIIRYLRVAPPRFLPDLGFVDLSTRYGMSLYGPVGTGVSDQFAAMPSIHVAWAAVAGFAVFAVSTRWWRWLGLAHVVLTTLVVAATGNHWWLDGIVAIALLGIGLRVDTAIRRWLTVRRPHITDDVASDDQHDDAVLAST